MEKLTWPQVRVKLPAVPLEQTARILDSGLKEQFASASVEVVVCPDLTRAPFHLAAAGLCGSAQYVADVGGPPYLVPMVNRSKIYSFESVLANLNAPSEHLQNALVIGASGGPFREVGSNCELVPNAYFRRKSHDEFELLKNNTHFAKIVSHLWPPLTVPIH